MKAFKSYSPNRQTDTHTHTEYENITFPHTPAVTSVLNYEFMMKHESFHLLH